jgi:CheY-like chemotaxis protein/two-component sensor histidine kinase
MNHGDLPVGPDQHDVMPDAMPDVMNDIDPRDLALIRHYGHDIRAVLAGLMDHLRLIAPDHLVPAAQTNLDAALRQAGAMARMIARAQSELTGEPAELPPTDLAELCRELETIFARPAALRGTCLSFRHDPALPGLLALDRVMLDRILRNLIGNALNHAGARRIEVVLDRAPQRHLRLVVRDDGTGFPAALLHGHALLHRAGSGLGLGIVASLVAAAAGRWGLTNPAGGGAEAWVELPFDLVPAPTQSPLAGAAAHAAARSDAGGRLAGHRVLAVDDSETALRLVTLILAAEGAVVDQARRGEDAIALVGRRVYDLLLVDANLPDLPGAQVIRALRARPGTAGRAPALAMTADTSAGRLDALIAAGANRVVTKPLPEPAEFLRIVERLLTVPAHVAPAPAAPAPPEAEVPLFDPDPLLRVLDLAGPDTAREILDRLVQDLTETLARLDHGGQRSDLMELRAATHVLIALAGTAGAMRLVARAQVFNHRLHTGALTDLGPGLAELRLLTEGAIVAISRLPVPGSDRT